MAGALLVTDEDVLHFFLLEQFVVDRKHRPAGIAEDVLDLVFDQWLHDHLGSRHFAPTGLALSLVHRPVPVAVRPAGRLKASSSVSSNKKGPRRSLCFAHGVLSPGGYTALPIRAPTTRMIPVVMGADIKVQWFVLSTQKMRLR